MAQKLPKLVSKLCYGYNGWIVGSGARDNKPKDYDIAIPFSNWRQASMLIPTDARPNSFGGWKCDYNGVAIDVWPCELAQLMTNEMVTHLWHPQSGSRFIRTINKQDDNNE